MAEQKKISKNRKKEKIIDKGVPEISSSDDEIMDNSDDDDYERIKNLGKHFKNEVIKSYELLEFEKKAKSYIRVFKLNDSRVDKEELMEKLCNFCLEYSMKIKTKSSSQRNFKSNLVLLNQIIYTLIRVLKFNQTFNWVKPELSLHMMLNLENIISVDFFESCKIISINELLNLDDVSKENTKITLTVIHRIIDLVSLTINLQSYIHASNNHPNKAFTCLYQSIFIKRIQINNHFDVFQNIFYCINFMSLLYKTGNAERAMSLQMSMMQVVENIIPILIIDYSVSSKTIIIFLENFVFFDEGIIDQTLSKTLYPVDDKMSPQVIRKALVNYLKLILTQMYKILGNKLHAMGRFNESYISMNIYNNLYADIAGDGTLLKYTSLLTQLDDIERKRNEKEGLNTKQGQTNIDNIMPGQKSDVNFYNKKWKLTKEKRKNKEGFFINEYIK